MSPSSGATHTIALSADARRDLVRLLRAAYPHEHFPDGPYERCADAIVEQIEESVWHRMALVQGLESLDDRAGGDFEALDDGAAEEVLRDLEDAEFFRFIRGVAVVTLYDDPETWKLLGYEGSSFEQGGYLHRGFDDLDWLPDPRIEEYDGPDALVEVADHDQPASTDATEETR